LVINEASYNPTVHQLKDGSILGQSNVKIFISMQVYAGHISAVDYILYYVT